MKKKMKFTLLALSILILLSQINKIQTYLYYIYSYLNKSLVLMPKDSCPGQVSVILFNFTKSDSQKWSILNTSSAYFLKNNGTGLYLHYGEEKGNQSEPINQKFFNENFNLSNYFQWNLSYINETNYFRIKAINETYNDDEEKYYITAKIGQKGEELFLEKLNSSNNGQIWYYKKEEDNDNDDFTREKALKISDAFLNRYYIDSIQSNGSIIKSLVLNYSSSSSIFAQIEMCELLLDGYETLGYEKFKEYFKNTYQDLIDYITKRNDKWENSTESDDWSVIPNNSDVMSLVIVSVRAHLILDNKNNKYLENAEKNFQKIYQRVFLGRRNLSPAQQDIEKINSFICATTVIASCYLAKATNNINYYSIAQNIHEIQKEKFYVQLTGKVSYSSVDNETYCQTQGTWIGSCIQLYLLFKNSDYLDYSKNSMNYIIQENGEFSNKYGILIKGKIIDNGKKNDFRSVLIRYIRMFIVEFAEIIPETDMSPFLTWIQKNAKVAYNNRNIYDLIQYEFNIATDNEMNYGILGMSGGISISMNMVYGEVLTKGRKAYQIIEVEEFNHIKGVSVNYFNNTEGKKKFISAKDKDYIGYSKLAFGDTTPSSTIFEIASISNNAFIEIHLDNPNGKIVGIMNIPSTGSLDNFIEVSCDLDKITGEHSIYLVFRNENDKEEINVGWFRFNALIEEEILCYNSKCNDLLKNCEIAIGNKKCKKCFNYYYLYEISPEEIICKKCPESCEICSSESLPPYKK